MTTLWVKHSKVVPSASSSSENIILVESTSPFDRYDFDSIGVAIDGINSNSRSVRNNECFETYSSYSTEKPHNFSLEASPVKKENSSLNILDSSFDDDIKFIGTNDKSVAMPKSKGLRHAHFDKLLDNVDSSAVLGISRFAHVNDTFAPSKSNPFINPHRKITVRAADDDTIHTSLIREIQVLNNRLALLEQVVHRMEYNITNPAQISDSSSASSNESHLDRPQDVAFTIDYTYDSFAKEEITYYNDDICPVNLIHGNHEKGYKFSLRRIFRGRATRKSSRVEV